LISSLEHEAARLNESANCQVNVLIEGNPLPVTETQHLVIFRAVQYFLNRLTQHDGFSKITLKVCFYDYNWQVIIYRPDNQNKWNEESEKEFLDEQALVLRRLSIIGGTFTINTEGETQIIINVPYA
jgi:glucose-6-phosphate-specific signal transduction histidine kinase